MDIFLKIMAGICLSALLIVLLRQEKSIGFVLAIFCAALAFLAVEQFLTPVLAVVDQFRSLSGIKSDLLTPLLKLLGIGLLCKLVQAFCRDAGQSTLEKTAEICAAVMALYVSLPLLEKYLVLMQSLIGG